MLYTFLSENRDELITRCKAKVALRSDRGASSEQLRNGVPLFLEQLIRTLVAETDGSNELAERVSGPSGGHLLARSEIGVAAAAHGGALLALGFTVDRVVQDYGDLCQAITELAYERDAPIRVDEFRTLNRCLDNAIADAVSEFSTQRDRVVAEHLGSLANERLGFLAHELRNALQLANLSVRALELGGLTLYGSTGSVLKRSLTSMRSLVDSALAEVRAGSSLPVPRTIFSLAAVINDARTAAQMEADLRVRVGRGGGGPGAARTGQPRPVARGRGEPSEQRLQVHGTPHRRALDCPMRPIATCSLMSRTGAADFNLTIRK